MTAWQKFLSFFGLGPKPPLRRADRVAAASTPTPPASAARPPRPEGSTEARPPREPKSPRPVIQHEVTSGRLYVSNLSYDATEADLTELFGGVGQVKSAEIVVNRNTQRSKGFAFVEMLNVEQAKRAVAELHDKEYMGRKMLVTGAKAPEAPGSTEGEPRRSDFRSDSRPSTSRYGESRSSEGRYSESRSSEERSSEGRSSEGRSSEGRFSEGRSSESRFSEGRSGEDRPPRREPRPAGGSTGGDVTTGIIRRESLAGGVVPAAGPVTLPPVVDAAPVATSDSQPSDSAPVPAPESASTGESAPPAPSA